MTSTPKDRLSLIVRHELSRYELPNEQVQHTWCYAPGELSGPPCQRQDADNFETMGIVTYQHTFSPDVLASFHGMVRDNANDFYSNPDSTPVQVFQHNWFREAYFKGTRHRASRPPGMESRRESDSIFLNENFRYNIPNIPMDTNEFDPHAADLRLCGESSGP